jgi:amino acid adenylation domain-containing protein
MSVQQAPETKHTAVDYDPFAGSDLARVVPTTEPQREVWLACRLSKEASLAYNESVSFRFTGHLNTGAMIGALQDLVDRHEALRSTISGNGEEMLVAATSNAAAVVVDHAITGPQDDTGRSNIIADAKRRAVETLFDLENGPLFRAEILKFAADDHLMVVTAHHIVFDGWSAGILAQDIARFYRARAADSPVNLPPAASFGDYAIKQRAGAGGSARAEDERYWLSRFSGQTPVLDLPSDRPRPAYRSFGSKREDYVLPADLVGEIRRAGAAAGSSLFVTLLAGFGALMQRIGGADEVVIGVPTAGQSVGGLDTLIGHCVNLLPIRLSLDGNGSARAAIDVTRTAMLDAYEHQEYTFGSLLKKLTIARDTSRLPLVNVMFNLDQALDTNALGLPGLTADFSINPRCAENFELSINAVQVGGAIRLECQYNTDLYDGTTVRRWMMAYESLLRALCANSDAGLASLPLISESDKEQIRQWNATSRSYSRTKLVHELFSERVSDAPDRVALSSQGKLLTYAELDSESTRIAHAMHSKGIGRGNLVGLFLERGPQMLTALLGVLKSGAGYVPLDPSYPQDRLAYMANDANLAMLVTQSALSGVIQWPPERTLLIDATLSASTDLEKTSLAPTGTTPEDVAYVIYTSGSTGKPKGVQVPHRAVVNFLESMARQPGFTKDDRVMAVTTLSFDIAVNELLLPLSIGAEIVLASREQAGDGDLLRKLIDDRQATTMQATPATWRLLLDAGWRGSRNFKALCGGEALSADLAQQLIDRSGELWNMYGPTETTVWSTCTRVRDLKRAVSIGQPIANTTIQILGQAGEQCPIGVSGEIWIGGDGVTLGYLNRPELNAERFVADAFCDRPGALLYRTGDRGRWHNDGQIEHLGRLDFQVKVRGYRIELGEIESTLATHPALARAVIIVREDRKDDVRLVAYVVARGGQSFSDADLLGHLKMTLPDYMIPQHFVTLPAIPLLPNGKVDRKALPAPITDVKAADSYVAPRSPLENTIVTAMESYLALPSIGVHDNFFSLGGHSLLASQLTSRLAKDLQLQIPMRALFEAPTAEKLAQWVEQQQKAGSKSRWSIERRANQDTAPLSAMQHRMWFLEQLDPGQPVNNSPSAHRLRGQLDETAFARAFSEMVRRQHALRTVIAIVDDEPRQIVLSEVPTELLPAIDFRQLSKEQREKLLLERINEQIRTPFDLTEPPLFRAKLYRLDEEEYVFFFMPHHIVWDGWSFDLLYHDMSVLYGAFLEGKPSPLPELSVSYGDFSAWHADWMESGEMASEVTHWTRRLAGALEPLAMPIDYPRPEVMSGNAKMMWLPVSADMVERTRQLSLGADATMFMTLLSVYVLLLRQLTGQSDVIIGTPVRGRQITELEPIMGFFVNALPLRIQVGERLTFMDLLAEVKNCALEAFKHPDVPFERLVRELDLPRDRSRTPVYQTMFSYQDARQRILRWGNLDRERVEVMQPGVAGDLNLWCVELQKGMLFGFSYAPGILSEKSASLIRDRYLHTLNTLLVNPHVPIDSLPLAQAEADLLHAWNKTEAAYDRNALMHSMFEQQSRRSPQRAAVSCDGSSLNYGELNMRANRLAHALRAKSVGRGQLVGLCLERGAEMLVAQLAILKCGAGYVPLDPAYPADRLAFMVQDAGLSMLLTDSVSSGLVEFPRERSIHVDTEQMQIATLSATDISADALSARPEDTAYVIYTSGSTGKPKGVQVPHRAVVNFLASMQMQPGLNAEDRLVAVTTLSFDIAVLELLLPLSVGAEVVLASREQALDGNALRTLLESSEASVMQATPATWRLLLDSGWRGPPGFKALIGGEALSIELATSLLPAVAELWNMYGPTETTVWSTCCRVTRPEQGISIGQPIANTQIHVLDEARRICPVGVAGEIWIGGDGVTSGYLNRPELTAERFIADPFSPRAGAKLYRTGDKGRWRADGQIEHMGRLDFQVKVRGYRIELGEIEATVAGFPGIVESVVLAREDVAGDVRLVAYYTTRGSADASALREHVRKILPAYMVPQNFVLLESIPRLPNGKINRAALPRPAETVQPKASVVHTPPTTETEKMLAEVWANLLKISDINADDNFFDIGGHSLLGMQAIVTMETRTGKRVNPRRYIFETLAQIARGYDETEAVPPSKTGTLKRFLSKLVGGGKN